MNEPWFDATLYGWAPGVLTGVAGFATSVVAGRLGPRGQRRRAVLSALAAQLCLAVLMLAAGVFGRISGQPGGVSFALALPGVINIVVLSVVTRRVLRNYRLSAGRRLASTA